MICSTVYRYDGEAMCSPGYGDSPQQMLLLIFPLNLCICSQPVVADKQVFVLFMLRIGQK